MPRSVGYAAVTDGLALRRPPESETGGFEAWKCRLRVEDRIVCDVVSWRFPWVWTDGTGVGSRDCEAWIRFSCC